MTDSRVKQPILRLEVLAPDGTRATDHVVFCKLQHQSVRVEECCRCEHCESIGEGAPGTGETAFVTCTIPKPAVRRSDDPDGERTEVGSLLCRGTVVLADSVSIGQALDVLHDGDRRSVAIVDPSHVLVGLVHESTFPGRMRLHGEAVSEAMTSAIALDERTPVRTALKLLASNHLREATVVSKRGVPIGVFRDVEGLHWIAGARHEDDPE